MNQHDFIYVMVQDADHTILIYDWQNSSLRFSIRGGELKVLSLSFTSSISTSCSLLPTDRLRSIRLLQAGVGHFTLLEGGKESNSKLTKKVGLYGAGVKKSTILCTLSLPLATGEGASGNEFLLGLPDGTIGVIAKGERKISSFFSVTTGAVTSMTLLKLKDATAEEPPSYKVSQCSSL